jgi:general secretion pathway protein A
MYTRFFGLQQIPFSIAPDPRYLYMSERHREALAHLLYGVNGGGGFVLLTGEIGAGKTTVCRLFLEQIPAECNVAYIFNPKQTVIELLRSICEEFHVDLPPTGSAATTVKDFIDPLNAFLLSAHAQQRNNVLIIDEAQNLSLDVLEQLRLLTNLETSQRKLLQIILIGQPELRSMLARPEMEQLAQRVIARFHLAALSSGETAQYIAHRLAVAGSERASPFSAPVMRRIHALARGIPRRINLLCDRALLGAYASGNAEVDRATVETAAREVFDLDTTAPSWRGRRRAIAAMVTAVSLSVALGAWQWSGMAVPPTLKAGASALMPSKTWAPARNQMTTDLVSAQPAGPEAAKKSAEPAAAAPVTSQPPVLAMAVATAAATEPATASASARDVGAAFQALAALWQLPAADSLSCATARHSGMSCFDGANGLAEIRLLDRPGILTLYDDQDEKYYAVLSNLGHDEATLHIGAAVETVALKALARRWRGGFTVLWRGAPGPPQKIVAGARGAAVDWLAQRLASARGEAVPAAGQVVTPALVAQVREFQIAEGLTPDGVAGPQTMMRLASAAGDPGPRLQSGK